MWRPEYEASHTCICTHNHGTDVDLRQCTISCIHVVQVHSLERKHSRLYTALQSCSTHDLYYSASKKLLQTLHSLTHSLTSLTIASWPNWLHAESFVCSRYTTREVQKSWTASWSFTRRQSCVRARGGGTQVRQCQLYRTYREHSPPSVEWGREGAWQSYLWQWWCGHG